MGRALVVLAVLAGVIAMHGLATGHHPAAAPVLPGLLAAADTDLSAHAHASAPSAPTVTVDDHDCDLLCQGNEHALALLCVAVLVTAAAAALALRQRSRALPRSAGRPDARLPRTAAPPRSFDPVAELCISRT